MSATRVSRFSTVKWLSGAVLAGGLLLAGVACATPVLVTSRVALGGTDHIDWSNAGAALTDPTNPFTINSQDGLVTTVSKSSSGAFERRDEGPSWFGNFAPGDAVLWTNNTSGPISLAFASNVFGGGAQIMADPYGAFTAMIEAFDGSGNLLGSFTLAGNADGFNDNSAIFIGILDSTADISRIDIGLTDGTDFAINQFDVGTNATSVPEPGALGLFGLGLAGLGALVWRKRRRAGVMAA